jgi:redox-sensitive bicupin YhaK (pirin superfamily)
MEDFTMISIRQAQDRGKANLGWLDSNHTFSFGHYHDPEHMGFGPLRVINEDRVKPGAGFDTHGHRDMEILSYVISGALEHKDSTGTGSVIRRGDIQRMTAGRGILHSEFNHSGEETVHFLQIWIIPAEAGLEPGYEQKQIDPGRGNNQLTLIASQEGGANAVRVHQDVALYLGELAAGHHLDYPMTESRGLWLQLVAGELDIAGTTLRAGDGLQVTDETQVPIEASQHAEFLLFDLPVMK